MTKLLLNGTFPKMLCACMAWALLATAWGQTPTLRDVAGHDLGERFTRHHHVVDFMEAMAEARPHWQLTQYGSTSEGRPLLGLVMSSPSNMERLDMLKADNALRVNKGIDRGDRVAWVYLSYNVHGNEAVCTEAAMATVEALATSHADLLDKAVVVLDPCVNPDGRDRYVHFQDVSTTSRVNADPNAWEHDEPWPGGRANHYLFDMNRDLAWQTQRETKARAAFYREWSRKCTSTFTSRASTAHTISLLRLSLTTR